MGPQSLEPGRAGGYRIGLPATSPPPPQPRGNRQAGSGQPFLSASSFPHSREEGRQGPLYALGSSGLLASCPCAQQVHGSPAHYHSSF